MGVVAKKRRVVGDANDKEQEAGGVGGATGSQLLILICAPGDGSLSPESQERLRQLKRDINEASSPDYEDLAWWQKPMPQGIHLTNRKTGTGASMWNAKLHS